MLPNKLKRRRLTSSRFLQFILILLVLIILVNYVYFTVTFFSCTPSVYFIHIPKTAGSYIVDAGIRNGLFWGQNPHSLSLSLSLSHLSLTSVTTFHISNIYIYILYIAISTRSFSHISFFFFFSPLHNVFNIKFNKIRK